ncbi:hypothetical protein ACXZ9C_11290 [Streptococcus agalactiae]
MASRGVVVVVASVVASASTWLGDVGVVVGRAWRRAWRCGDVVWRRRRWSWSLCVAWRQ